MQFTGCDQTKQRGHWLKNAIDWPLYNGNEKRNATCAASKTSKVSTQDALLSISYSMLAQSVRIKLLIAGFYFGFVIHSYVGCPA